MQITGPGVTATGRIQPVTITITDEQITAVEPQTGRAWDHDGFILPGLVDTHCHGGGGFAFTDPDIEAAASAAEYQHRRGATTVFGSLVTASPDDLLRSVRMLSELCDDGLLDGIHLEGPWLSPAQRGAHDPRWLRVPDPVEIDRLLRAAGGYLRQVTLAPEIEDADLLIDALVEEGVHIAIGHTAASYDVVQHAIGCGADVATHLFNGMDQWHHRSPGPIPALLAAAASGQATVELIGDGVHLAPETVAAVLTMLPPGRVVFVSDAIAAAGMPDGSHLLGTMPVRVTGGVARLDQPGDEPPLAGGTSHLADQLRLLAGMPDVIAATTSTPARLYGLADRGVLKVGARADLLLVDSAFGVQRVMRRGRWLDPVASS
ncbi:N-acetylglucosamine-6-phosphate deacetylase [Brooklawnia cerclae]|uniref:N-acetylglucosamine-6-phosphate deacetylase n=1 Tax=Brooklawnia cerclae TaxID=349934 RepID=A0ABX0SMJ6_9ACTN|nr:amidohydrolase family protein [Brooklawnia cerclae]NIH58260.1 N-acetylglucosamine-6-phosphate deacetylase [Brooklawnia cerclae]